MRPGDPTSPYRSSLESRYAERLELLKRSTNDPLIDWRYEPVTFALGGGVRYTPDFMLIYGDRFEFHETKGFWKEAGRARVRIAAGVFPWARFVGVMWNRKGKEWVYENFN